MAEVEYLHICDYAFSGEAGKQCVIGIFDTISVLALPATHPMMAIALKIQGVAHEVLAVKIELGRPNGDVLAKLDPQITLGPDGAAYIQMHLGGIQFPEAGRYTVKASVGGKTLMTQSLKVQKVQQPPQFQSAPPGAEPKKFH